MNLPSSSSPSLLLSPREGRKFNFTGGFGVCRYHTACLKHTNVREREISLRKCFSLQQADWFPAVSFINEDSDKSNAA